MLLHLVEEGFFGNPALGLQQLLEVAYTDFTCWARISGISHSQQKFHPNFVIKRATGAYMTSKGWNSKLLLFWLADCTVRAFQKQLDVPGRMFGAWLTERGSAAPETDFLAPQALALHLALSFCSELQLRVERP